LITPRFTPSEAPHTGGINMAFCDGSVQSIDFAVDRLVFALKGGRNDEISSPE
jgi:prepilin-type processing-associated H-X9-DG protein